MASGWCDAVLEAGGFVTGAYFRNGECVFLTELRVACNSAD